MAFVFEKLVVYQKSIEVYSDIRNIWLSQHESDKIIKRQLLRSSLSIPLKIAESCGKDGKKDRRNYLLIARGSLYEPVSTLRILERNELIKPALYKRLYDSLTEISKMLYTMIKKLEQEIEMGK